MRAAFNRCCLLFALACGVNGAPTFLDREFELPEGFHIYRAAGPDLSGGSYDLAFDGQGRLLVGDGNAVRRLSDADQNGVFDSFEVIASNLGWRGPQGLLVRGDYLYAVGGDGIQVFEGYGSASGLAHKGRIGQPFRTGGDHDAHTILRGHDGYLYFISGDGGGTKDRMHITESNSPVLFERAASVFRISPDGERWECVGAGGRNPPNLGQNYLGELFSFDSDMEWHVGLPWWRPVRLNHWLTGGDQGWQEVGAYPPHYIDCLPGVLDVGRGSPTWGVFYEHTQFPTRYRDSFIVCDYRWKRESSDQYHTTGRLVAFFLQRDRAGWKATMEILAQPKPDARDAAGKPISFALVDIEVAPDGSIFLSDHNQGIWRIVYGDQQGAFAKMQAPTGALPLENLLKLPQPASEWSRLAEEDLKHKIDDWKTHLQAVALDAKRDHKLRLRAVRLLAGEFVILPDAFIESLSTDPHPELRGQAAWLMGIRVDPKVVVLLRDEDSFVRRRAAEALTRIPGAPADALIAAMGDPERLVRYAAMAAMAHQPTMQWFDRAASSASPQARMRGLVAAKMRREIPSREAVGNAIAALVNERQLSNEDILDLLRVLGIFREQLAGGESASKFLLGGFPSDDPTIRLEQARLLGDYRLNAAFPKLLTVLENEPDRLRQFHFAQAIAKLSDGWSAGEEQRLLTWVLQQQRGWFAEFSGKGVEFPQFWATVLADFGRQHRAALLGAASRIDLRGLLGGVYVDLLAAEPNGIPALIALHAKSPEAKIARRLAQFSGTPSSEHRRIVEEAFTGNAEPEVARACAEFLARNPPSNKQIAAERAISHMEQHRSLFPTMTNLLASLAGTNLPVKTAEGRIAPGERERTAAAWRALFGLENSLAQVPERSDDEIYDLIVTGKLEGNAKAGGEIYERLLCHTCHGGGVNPGREGRIFGPDLAGVTRRLNRNEFADSLVYPSRQVPDRFKAYELALKKGGFLTGFITEQTDRAVTFVERDQVREVARGDITSLAPQKGSLMPDKLLNRLTDQDLADLLAFLEK